MMNRRVIKEVVNPYAWVYKLYKVKVLRSWTKGARRFSVVDISVFGSEHPRFTQYNKAAECRLKAKRRARIEQYKL